MKLFLSIWYFQNFGLTDLLVHNKKVTSDKKTLFISDQRNMGGNRDYCSYLSVIFEAMNKSPIFFLQLVFGKVRVDRVTGSRREIDVRYEFYLKVILKGLGCKQRSLQPFLIEFLKIIKYVIVIVRWILPQVGVDDSTSHNRKLTSQTNFFFSQYYVS